MWQLQIYEVDTHSVGWSGLMSVLPVPVLPHRVASWGATYILSRQCAEMAQLTDLNKDNAQELIFLGAGH